MPQLVSQRNGPVYCVEGRCEFPLVTEDAGDRVDVGVIDVEGIWGFLADNNGAHCDCILIRRGDGFLRLITVEMKSSLFERDPGNVKDHIDRLARNLAGKIVSCLELSHRVLGGVLRRGNLRYECYVLTRRFSNPQILIWLTGKIKENIRQRVPNSDIRCWNFNSNIVVPGCGIPPARPPGSCGPETRAGGLASPL